MKFRVPQHPSLQYLPASALAVSAVIAILILRHALLTPQTLRVSTHALNMEFGLVPAGTFPMQLGNNPDAWPQVRISKPFFLGTYEVTKEQFAIFVASTGYVTRAEQLDGHGKSYGLGDSTQNWKSAEFEDGPLHPVVNVSHEDAVQFCRWLSQIDGHVYRLPTSAEWEYACLAGQRFETPQYVNRKDMSKVGNLYDQSFWDANPQKKRNRQEGSYPLGHDGWVYTSPVGSYRPNGYQIHDLLGNVMEWCSDFGYEDNDYLELLRTAGSNDPLFRRGRDVRMRRVRAVRGPSFTSFSIGPISAFPLDKDLFLSNLGFRVVREL